MQKYNLKVKVPLFLIFGLGLFLRTVALTKYPAGLTPDEAAQGYTAYSVLKTGKDEWGEKLPLNLRSFGDYKPPLQTYLMIPSVAVFGLNEFAVRLPNALLSSLSIFGVFLLASEFFKDKKIGIIAAFLLAFSPWHLPLSRGAFEANLNVFFVSFGIWYLLKAFRESKKGYQFLAGLFLGLNMFSYHSPKLVTPLLVLLFTIYWLLFSKKKLSKVEFVKQNGLFFVCYILFFLLAFSSFFAGGQTRGMDVAIFNPTDNWQVVKDARWWSSREVGMPDLISRIFNNKLFYFIKKVASNYLSYLSPQFLFSEGPKGADYGMIPGYGVLWWWQLPVLVFLFSQLIRRGKKIPEVKLLLILVLLSLLPAAITKGTRAANRAAVVLPWIQLIFAWSLYQLKVKARKLKINGRVISLTALSIFLIFFAFFLESYFVQSPRTAAKQMLYGRCPVLRWVQENYPDAKQVIISRRLSEPQAYVTFCLKYPPELVQEQSPQWLEYQERGLSFLDQLGEYHLGKYSFREINWASDSVLENAVLIGVPKEFLVKVPGMETILYPNQDPAIIIYKTKSPETHVSIR